VPPAIEPAAPKGDGDRNPSEIAEQFHQPDDYTEAMFSVG
jgi:hypothetical protein